MSKFEILGLVAFVLLFLWVVMIFVVGFAISYYFHCRFDYLKRVTAFDAVEQSEEKDSSVSIVH